MSTTTRVLEEFKDGWEGHIQRLHDALVDGYWHQNAYRLKFKDKKEDFEHNQKTAENLLEALQVLLSKVDGYREKVGVQKYINSIVNSIKIHLNRISKYFLKNKPRGFQKKENQKEEYQFQRQVFKGEREISDILKKLDIENKMEGFKVVLHTGKLASICMKEPMEMEMSSVKAKVETLELDWGEVKDKRFFINIPKREVPDYIDTRHFWEQEMDTLNFYVNEWAKIKEGFYLGDYFVHPWLYFHLNFFNTPIPEFKDGKFLGEIVKLPTLRDNEWYIAEILKRAEDRRDAGILIYGSRRFAKSSIIASYLLWKAMISPNGNISITSGNDKDLGDLTDKMETAMKAMNPAFRIETNKEDWSKEVEFGLKTKSNRKIKLCDARVMNLDDGSSTGGQKTAGGAPVAFVIEEIGKFSWRSAFDTAIPSFEAGEGWKTIPLLIGTGGEESLSKDAETVLNDPEANDLMEIDWELLERHVPKEAITWNRRKFGWFVPAQMGYKTGFKRIEKTFSDFLGVDNEELSKIIIHQTDWVNNTEVCRKRRKKLKFDKKKLQKEIVFYPLDPDECFMSAKENPYPAQGIKKHKERLQAEGSKIYGIATRIGLKRDNLNPKRIERFVDTDRNVSEFPHDGSYIDCPFLLFDDFPETPPTDKYRFCAGLDDVKQEQSQGDSIASFYIFDRLKRKIVLSLATRPDPKIKFHREIHMALDAWNAMCFMENEDMDFKKYLDRVSDPSFYLYKGFDAHSDFANGKFQNGKRTFGWRPDKNTVPIVRGYTIDYTKDDVDYVNSEGIITHTVAGYERIEDIQLLEEMIKYKPNGNFDRLVSFGSCLAIDYYLTSNYITPQSYSVKKPEEEKPEPPKTRTSKYFTKTRRSLF